MRLNRFGLALLVLFSGFVGVGCKNGLNFNGIVNGSSYAAALFKSACEYDCELYIYSSPSGAAPIKLHKSHWFYTACSASSELPNGLSVELASFAYSGLCDQLSEFPVPFANRAEAGCAVHLSGDPTVTAFYFGKTDFAKPEECTTLEAKDIDFPFDLLSSTNLSKLNDFSCPTLIQVSNYYGCTSTSTDANCAALTAMMNSKAPSCLPPAPAPVCGNGVKESGEQCDDGNTANNDGCNSACQLERCGDAVQQSGEECDDGNTVNGDGCEFDCRLPYCGNGIKDPDEICDDGNTTNGDNCDNNCTIPGCGNGALDPNEQCDNGVENSDTLVDRCRTNCQNPSCGDTVCDTFESFETCPADCTCGNGVCDAGEEGGVCAPDCGCDNDGTCELGRGETTALCGDDCFCGDAVCDSSETATCPADCSAD